MEEINLTKDAEKLICVVYKSYLEKRKNGITKANAKNLGNSHLIHEQFFPKWLFKDVDDTCRELSRAGLLDCKWANNTGYLVRISDKGILYLENRFKNGLKEVIEFLAGILPSIPL